MGSPETKDTIKDLISIIIPVYNVEKYLDACLESVVSQTYKNFEAILVNDGSTDDSLKICNSYCERDPRFRTITTENGGLSMARNRGMDIAQGEFICFLDSDDMFHERYLETLHDLILQYDADFSCCAFTRKDPPRWSTEPPHIYSESGEEILDHMNRDDVVKTVVWNKLYRRRLIEDNRLRFEAGRLYEDMLFTPQMLYCSKRAVYTDERLHYYRVRKDSIMQRKFSEKSLHFHDSLCRRADFFKKLGKKDLYYHEIDNLIFKVYKNMSDFESNRDNENICREYRKFRDYIGTAIKNPAVFMHISCKSKVKAILILFKRS